MVLKCAEEGCPETWQDTNTAADRQAFTDAGWRRWGAELICPTHGKVILAALSALPGRRV